MAEQLRGYWTYSTVLDAAKNCNSLTEFNRECRGAYDHARRHGFLDEIIRKSGLKNRRALWTKKTITNAAITCESYKQFREEYPTAYRLYLCNKPLFSRINTHFRKMEEKRACEKARAKRAA